MANPVLLSGSSLNVFNECPREWEYQYIWALQRPPSYKMALGTAAHFAVEVAMKERLTAPEYPPASVWNDAFETKWAEETAGTSPRNDTKEESTEAHIESGLRCVEFYRTTIAPTIVPFAVELPISFSINGHVWTGTADLIQDLDPGSSVRRIAIRDHKFSSKRPDKPARYKWPMIGYAIGVRRIFDVVEEDIQLDYIIRNKKPVHFPVSNGGPASDRDIVQLAQEVENAMTAIKRGSFPPLGRQNGACNWCPFWDICPDYKGRKKQSPSPA
jgi:hypothetical protein